MLVRDQMSTPTVTVRNDEDYKDALRLMQEKALHHLPVVDAAGQLVGIAAERDLILAATRYLQSAVEVGGSCTAVRLRRRRTCPSPLRRT